MPELAVYEARCRECGFCSQVASKSKDEAERELRARHAKQSMWQCPPDALRVYKAREETEIDGSDATSSEGPIYVIK